MLQQLIGFTWFSIVLCTFARNLKKECTAERNSSIVPCTIMCTYKNIRPNCTRGLSTCLVVDECRIILDIPGGYRHMIVHVIYIYIGTRSALHVHVWACFLEYISCCRSFRMLQYRAACHLNDEHNQVFIEEFLTPSRPSSRGDTPP